MRNLSIWDVVECFNPPTKSTHNVHSSPELCLTNLIAEQAFQLEKEFLEKFPISHLVSEWIESDSLEQGKSIAMNEL
jgi:DNA-binding IscR family transcriptional regulator